MHPKPPGWLVGLVPGAPLLRADAFELPFNEGRLQRVFLLHPLDPQRAGVAGRSSWATRWRLEPRHARVALLAMVGRTDKEIASELGLETNTVRTYMQAVRARVGVSTRTELLFAALTLCLTPPESAFADACSERRDRVRSI